MKYTKIRTDIAKLVTEQIELKPQRKTVHFSGVRKVESYTATMTVLSNKDRLRHLYDAYAILRGKERTKSVKKETSQSLVDKYVLEYTQE